MADSDGSASGLWVWPNASWDLVPFSMEAATVVELAVLHVGQRLKLQWKSGPSFVGLGLGHSRVSLSEELGDWDMHSEALSLVVKLQ